MELEAQLISLRKQIAEQSRVVKLKEQTDKQAEKLAAEILVSGGRGDTDKWWRVEILVSGGEWRY